MLNSNGVVIASMFLNHLTVRRYSKQSECGCLISSREQGIYPTLIIVLVCLKMTCHDDIARTTSHATVHNADAGLKNLPTQSLRPQIPIDRSMSSAPQVICLHETTDHRGPKQGRKGDSSFSTVRPKDDGCKNGLEAV